MLYNILKGGVDGLTQFITAIAIKAKQDVKMTVEQKLVIRLLRTLSVNAGILHRILSVLNDPSFEFTDLASFRRHCNEVEAIPKYVYNLSLELLRNVELEEKRMGFKRGAAAMVESMNTATMTTTSNAVQKMQALSGKAFDFMTTRKPREDVARAFDAKFKTLRLDKTLQHEPKLKDVRVVKKGADAGRTKFNYSNCILCKRKSRYYCGTCFTPLCNSLQDLREKTCFHKFHNCTRLRLVDRTQKTHSALSTEQPLTNVTNLTNWGY